MQAKVQQDITQGSLGDSLRRLSWPIIVGSALLMLPGVYDAIWLGQLGSDAQAAAGLTMSVRIVMISALMALSLGGGAVVARYVGAGDREKANLSVLQAIILFIATSGSLGIIGVVFVRPLMLLGGADAATLPLAVRYARIIFVGLVAMELVPSIGFMLSAAGAPQVMLGMALLSTVTLVVAEPLMVHWLGLEGAALALILSNAVGMLYGLVVLLSGRAPIRLDLHNLRLDFPIMGQIVRVTLPAVLLRGAPNLAMLLLTRFVAWYGAEVLAAWIIVQRVYGFATIPSQGMARAAPAMVGQNLGAAQPDRATRAVSLIARTATLTAVGVIGLLVLFASLIMALFSSDPETITAGVHVMRTLSIGYLAFAVGGVFDMAQTGAGDTLGPMIINLISLWLLQVPLAYTLSHLAGLKADGIWLALNLGWIIQAMMLGLRFRQGHWKVKQIV
jgi:putative MATE family efflux protein